MILLGKLVNTHGIKGEVRIISDFKYKNIVFQKDSHLYINNDKLTINTYRVHKNYDMVTFDGINDINEVLKYKGKDVYIDQDEFDFPGLLTEDLIGLPVYENDKLLGNVKDIVKNVNQELLVLEDDTMIPMVPEFIKEISKTQIQLKLIISRCILWTVTMASARKSRVRRKRSKRRSSM